jgi:hypothetical protein
MKNFDNSGAGRAAALPRMRDGSFADEPIQLDG